MSDDDHSPASSTDGHPGGSGFTAFGDSDRKAEQRKRRRGLAGKAVAGALVLGAVAGVAAATSGGHAKSAPVVAAGPTVGKATGLVPPQVIFVTAQQGYAFAVRCDSQPVGQGCRPVLSETTDGAASWTPVPLPAGTPVDPTHSYGMMAHGHDVLLAWTDTDFVSRDDGKSWTPVKVDNAGGTVSEVPVDDFLVGNESRLLVVDPTGATALTFRPPQKVELPGGLGGKLSETMVWMRDTVSVGISTDNGVHWNVNPLPDGNVAVAPLLGAPGFLALLTGPAKDATIGVPGDGGELPAANAYFSTNAGGTWATPTVLSGPKVNAGCTVYLGDHSLLGVATDGKSLLSLQADKSEFVAAKDQPTVTPYCLQSHGALVWGTTADNQVVLKTDTARGWAIHKLPSARAVAVPSPTPSATQ